jgi:hypothetical protein
VRGRHLIGICDGAIKVRAYHTDMTLTSLSMRECDERSSYIVVEEPKSVSEAYIRVAVIDVDSSADNTNANIGGGRRRGVRS